MCRVAGLINKRLSADELKGKVTAMCDSIKHGGPDDGGIFFDANTGVCLGNRRLAIMDLSTNGHQPMTDGNERVWITFNGEVYNYRILRNELLALGAQFISDTDTEVVLQAYLHWGTESFSKLQGMFAFALYDVVERSVFLVRDSAGIKPLYYAITQDELAFSSEIRAFKAANVFNIPNPKWPVWLLSLGHIPEPHTTLKDVQALPKAHFLCRRADGCHEIVKYHTEKTIDYITDPGEVKAGIFELVTRSVKRQLVADAPIGVFLSGGIDSSLLTLLAADDNAERLNTISVYFEDKAYDERAYQDTVIRIANCKNHKHLVQQSDFDTQFDHILSAMDMPTTDGINTWFISKYAREAGLKAVLSGVGADELFGGYPSFKRVNYLEYGRRVPKWITKIAGALDSRYKKFEYLKYHHTLADYLFLRGLFDPEQIAQLLDMSEEEVTGILFSDVRETPHLCNEEYAAWLETNLYMQNQLLRDTDVLSMSHGLEVRVPFLDDDLRAFARQIAPTIRFNKKQPKKILTETFSSILPKTVWDRPKMGFTFPLQQWMSDNKQLNNDMLYRNKAAKKAINDFRNGRLHWSRAFALYQVQANA